MDEEETSVEVGDAPIEVLFDVDLNAEVAISNAESLRKTVGGSGWQKRSSRG